MARTIQEINNQILTNIANDSVLGSQLTSTSQTAKFRLWSYIVATSIAFFEQLMDLFLAQVESKLTLIAPNTPQWTQAQIFAWQYNYQAIYQTDKTQPNYGYFYYPVIDTTANIVTQCSVITLPNKTVSIKVASNSTALTTPQKTQLSSYITEAILPVGIGFILTSIAGDKLYFTGSIQYDGQYSDIIQSNVQTAITNYLSNLPFNGIMKINNIIDAVIGVQGVNNFTITNLYNVDANTTTINLITSNNWLQNTLNPVSGYFQASDFTNLTYIAS
jgi:hypothetical protein